MSGQTVPGRKRYLMKSKLTDPQTRLYLISAIILAVGLFSAVLIYLKAVPPPDSTLIHDFENSKRYIHDLELYGGKMNVLADQFRRWFNGLWEGKSLAYMVASITILVSLACSIVAYHLPAGSGTDSGPEDDRTDRRFDRKY
jgi:hypothetical protein